MKPNSHSTELDELTQQQLDREGVAGLGKRVRGFFFFVLALLLQWRNVWSASAVVIAYGIYDHYQGTASEFLFRIAGVLVFVLAAYRLHKKERRAALDRENTLENELAALRTKREVDGRAREGLLNDIARLREAAARSDALDLENRRLSSEVDSLKKAAQEANRVLAESSKASPVLRLAFDPDDGNCHGEGRALSVKLVNEGEKAARASVILGELVVDGQRVVIEPNQPFPEAFENVYAADVSPGIPKYFALFRNSDHAGNREQGLATWSLTLKGARLPLRGHTLELDLRIQTEVRAGGLRLRFKQSADNPSFLAFESHMPIEP